MALKDFLNKIQYTSFTYNQKKSEFNIFQNIKLIIYPTVFIFALITYFTTYNSINDQKIQNEKNLEIFLNSKDFTHTKRSFFQSMKGPYFEFSYKIENNDSIGRILKKFRVSNSEIQKIIEGLKKKKIDQYLCRKRFKYCFEKIR